MAGKQQTTEKNQRKQNNNAPAAAIDLIRYSITALKKSQSDIKATKNKLHIPTLRKDPIITPPLQLPNKLWNELPHFNVCPKNQYTINIHVYD